MYKEKKRGRAHRTIITFYYPMGRYSTINIVRNEKFDKIYILETSLLQNGTLRTSCTLVG